MRALTPLRKFKWVHRSASSSIWHSSPLTCPALEKHRDSFHGQDFKEHFNEFYHHKRIPTGDVAAFTELGRVCRRCAQASFIAHLVNTAPGPKAWCSLSLCDPALSLESVSESASSRTRAIAVATTLQVTTSALGPVLYGPLPRVALKFITANAHVQLTPAGLDLVSISTAWGLQSMSFDQALEVAISVHA